FMQDFRLPDMLLARVVRPKAIGAQLQSFDDTRCRALPDFVATVRKRNFLAGVSKSEWGAGKASRMIDTHWSEWAGLPEQARLWDWVRSVKINKTEVLQEAGDAAAALAAPSARVFSASYDFPVQTHGSLGPSCAVAHYADGKLTS